MAQDPPLLTYLLDNITHIVFSTDYDPPNLYFLESLADIGLEIDRVEVTPVLKASPVSLMLQYDLDTATANCPSAVVTDISGDGLTITLDDGSFLNETGRDRVEFIDVDDNNLGDRKVVSRTGDVIIISEPVFNAVTLNLKISKIAIVIDGTSTAGTGDVIDNGWQQFILYKNSDMDLKQQDNIFVGRYQ